MSQSVSDTISRARCALRDLCVMLMGHTAHTQEGGGSALLRLSAEKGAARGSRRVRRGERGAGSLESPRGDLAHNSFFCFGTVHMVPRADHTLQTQISFYSASRRISQIPLNSAEFGGVPQMNAESGGQSRNVPEGIVTLHGVEPKRERSMGRLHVRLT